MKVEFVKSFKRVSISLARRLRIQLSVFLICLILSILTWFIIKLSNQYTEPLKYPLTYTNVPGDKMLTGTVDRSLTLTLKTSGFRLLSTMYFNNDDTVHIDLSRVNLQKENDHYEAYLTEFALNEIISNSLEITPTQITGIIPDTLFISMQETYEKKVPVKLSLDLSFEDQYFLYDSLNPKPDSVTITGIKEDVSRISTISTKQKRITNLKNDRKLQIDLEKPKTTKGVKLDPARVSLNIDVERYTESSVKVPVINIESEGTDYMIRTFPQEVEITYLVALKDYKEIDPSMFVAGINGKKAYYPGAQYLKVRLINKPENVKITRIKPEKVEYIILQ